LRQAIAWSYDLLDPDAQRLFRGLGVFVGGFTLEMGEEVCGAEAEDHRSGGERGYGLVLDTLGILVENHLVERADVTGGGEAPRFGMLETIRDYAQERLASSGEAAVFRRRHAEAFVRLGEEANPELDGAHQRTWLKRLDAEAHNIHAALGWCLEKGEPELGLRLGGAIFKFWSKRGHAEDGRRLDELLEKGGAVAAAVRAKALNAAAYMAYNRGDLAHAEELLEEAVALRRELGDRSATAKTLANLGMMVTYRGDYPRARRLLEETLELLRSLGEKSGVANDLLNLGIVASYEGDLEAAVGFFEEGLDIFRALGDIWSIATTQQDLGSALLHRGDYARAREQLDEAIELFGSLDDSHGVAQVKLNRGALALCEGDAALATSLLREALSRLDEVGDRRALTACLDGLAQAAAATGDAARAARLMGSAETLRAVGGFPWAPGEKALRDGARARVRILLGEETMNAAWAEGAALPLANAVAEALGVQAPVASGRMPA
jgi:tetratricopeptide (TPR) repeat protein